MSIAIHKVSLRDGKIIIMINRADIPELKICSKILRYFAYFISTFISTFTYSRLNYNLHVPLWLLEIIQLRAKVKCRMALRGNSIFTIRFSLTSKNSFKMIIQSKSSKFALSENLSSSFVLRSLLVLTDPHLFSLFLSLSFSFLPLCLSSFLLLILPPIFLFLSIVSWGNTRRQVKSLKSILL